MTTAAPGQIAHVVHLWRAGKSMAQIARVVGLPMRGVYRVVVVTGELRRAVDVGRRAANGRQF